jgi:hypothetical protein
MELRPDLHGSKENQCIFLYLKKAQTDIPSFLDICSIWKPLASREIIQFWRSREMLHDKIGEKEQEKKLSIYTIFVQSYHHVSIVKFLNDWMAKNSAHIS